MCLIAVCVGNSEIQSVRNNFSPSDTRESKNRTGRAAHPRARAAQVPRARAASTKRRIRSRSTTTLCRWSCTLSSRSCATSSTSRRGACAGPTATHFGTGGSARAGVGMRSSVSVLRTRRGSFCGPYSQCHAALPSTPRSDCA